MDQIIEGNGQSGAQPVNHSSDTSDLRVGGLVHHLAHQWLTLEVTDEGMSAMPSMATDCGQHYLHFGEFGDNGIQFVSKVLLSELHFSHIEGPDPRYLVVLVDNSRRLPLRLRQHDINEVFGGRNHCNALEVISRAHIRIDKMTANCIQKAMKTWFDFRFSECSGKTTPFQNSFQGLCSLNMYFVLFLFFILYLFSFSDSATNSVAKNPENNSKLLIILVDGFRWDYVARDKTLKGFPKIAQNGVSAKYVKPIFPENSYPNWYSITTGRYAENHGFIQNYMYDNVTHELFLMSPNSYPNWYSITTGRYAENHGFIQNYMYDNVTHELFLMSPAPNCSQPHWWTQSEPLWITAEKNNIKTAMYVWDGCQVTIDGVNVTHCTPYYFTSDDVTKASNITRNYGQQIYLLKRRLFMSERNEMVLKQLVCPYGHGFGPNSENITQAVRAIDEVLNELFDSIVERKLDKEVNVVIVSDHGMTQIDDFKQIELKDVIDFKNSVQLYLGSGSGAQIVPKPGKEEEIYKNLNQVKGITVYKKDDIPEKFHYKHNSLVLPLLVTVDAGYTIAAPRLEGVVYYGDSGKKPQGGNHGYSVETSPDIRAIMYGFGPALKKNYTSDWISMVDHYNLFCHILGINPIPNNGTDAKAKAMLVSSSGNRAHYSVLLFSILVTCVLKEIHPFFADLINVLYDRDHYKLALGQLNTCKHIVDNHCYDTPVPLPVHSIARDYVRLLKYGDSLYRCKQLKRAALGRMATIMKRQNQNLQYLEQ
ncbi:unnamed protein product, partial [Oppiella nova]